MLIKWNFSPIFQFMNGKAQCTQSTYRWILCRLNFVRSKFGALSLDPNAEQSHHHRQLYFWGLNIHTDNIRATRHCYFHLLPIAIMLHSDLLQLPHRCRYNWSSVLIMHIRCQAVRVSLFLYSLSKKNQCKKGFWMKSCSMPLKDHFCTLKPTFGWTWTLFTLDML